MDDLNMKANFESKVNRQIERLSKYSFQVIEREVAEKRIAWFKQNHGDTDGFNLALPQGVFELLFFDYMGLAKRELSNFLYSSTFLKLIKLLRSKPRVLKKDNKSVESHRTDV